VEAPQAARPLNLHVCLRLLAAAAVDGMGGARSAAVGLGVLPAQHVSSCDVGKHVKYGHHAEKGLHRGVRVGWVVGVRVAGGGLASSPRCCLWCRQEREQEQVREQAQRRSAPHKTVPLPSHPGRPGV